MLCLVPSRRCASQLAHLRQLLVQLAAFGSKSNGALEFSDAAAAALAAALAQQDEPKTNPSETDGFLERDPNASLN